MCGHLLFTAATEALAFSESRVEIFDLRASAKTVLETLQSLGLVFLSSWKLIGWTLPIFSHFIAPVKPVKQSNDEEV